MLCENSENMGNCLKTPTADDISLLRGSDSQDGSDISNLGPPPPYQVRFLAFRIFSAWSQSHSVGQ